MDTLRRKKIQDIFEGFMVLQKAMGTQKDNFLKGYDLTRPQMHILYVLAQDGELTVKEVAARMGITSSAATQIIQGLVNSSYVERQPDTRDRRIVHIVFSLEGKKKFEKFRKAHIERLGLIFDILSDEELDLLIDIPKKALAQRNCPCKTTS